jgi:hypothetical protein
MIFLGETFSGFVTVHNDSKETVRDVNLKVSGHLKSSGALSLPVTMVTG